MFKRVLICTDFSDSLQRFANFVPDLAKGGMTHLVFFHNVPLMTSREIPCVDEERVSKARERLAIAKSNVPEGTTVEIEVASGRASDNIVRAVKEHQPDIIFSGMPTRSVLNERLFGSTTMALAEKAKTPLLILRPQLISTYRESELAQRCQNMFDYFLLPYDGSENADSLVKEIKTRIQADPDCALATCLLSWVIDGGGRIPSGDLAKNAQTKLKKVAAQLEGLGSQIETEVRVGDPLEEILKSGEMHDISAIAVRPGKNKGLLKLTVPSFTNAMLRASWHPIVHFPHSDK
ncbi:universal stress protein [cf. Phormidesmis sp. LEGE 11477]|uniref:universal stress protein n=1 Tax=cf. Phormidesmis sp. LEGE 11477 TaxID=1828680 RepID=UPI00187E424F|nr:universal stress protein [cf. Phormidesmis sp. LEGE 11477]MBE9060174.1 universal stress protein [cf. Phormidesmis sp. LEGE 11477]